MISLGLNSNDLFNLIFYGGVNLKGFNLDIFNFEVFNVEEFNFEVIVSLFMGSEIPIWIGTSILLGLLKGILSLSNLDGSDTGEDGPDPGENGPDPGEGGPDPGGDGPDPGGDGPDKNPPYKGKGKARATTPEYLSEEDLFLEQLKKEEEAKKEADRLFDKETAEAIRISQDEQDNNPYAGESSKAGRISSEIEAEKLKKYEEAKDRFNTASAEFNEVHGRVMDDPTLSPEDKEFLLGESLELRKVADFYKKEADKLHGGLLKSTVKTLEAEQEEQERLRQEQETSSEEEADYEEESSPGDNNSKDNNSRDSSSKNPRFGDKDSKDNNSRDSSPENPKPSKRPRN